MLNRSGDARIAGAAGGMSGIVLAMSISGLHCCGTGRVAVGPHCGNCEKAPALKAQSSGKMQRLAGKNSPVWPSPLPVAVFESRAGQLSVRTQPFTCTTAATLSETVAVTGPSV